MKVYTVVIDCGSFSLFPGGPMVFSDAEDAVRHAEDVARAHPGETIRLVEGVAIKEFRVEPQPVGVVDLVP